jgi:hypothetical protein
MQVIIQILNFTIKYLLSEQANYFNISYLNEDKNTLKSTDIWRVKVNF